MKGCRQKIRVRHDFLLHCQMQSELFQAIKHIIISKLDLSHIYIFELLFFVLYLCSILKISISFSSASPYYRTKLRGLYTTAKADAEAECG